MSGLKFADPGFFYLFILVVAMIAWYFYRQRTSSASIQTSSLKPFEKSPKTYKHYFRHGVFVLRVIAISLLIVVMARPQSTNSWKDVTTEGIDIVMSLDISGTMLAEDFKPNRLGAAKDVATEFINGRPNDRVGLVVFSGESFTQCPLTTDHAVLINLFKDVKYGMIEDGTAIGLGLANAVNRLKESTARSKVVILLTDGMNNRGEIAPITAAEIAQTFGIRVYTVGVGTRGTAPYPGKDMFGRTVYQNIPVEIDEKVLQDIATMTDGKYFRATDNQKLRQIYREIDRLEKSKIDVKEYNKRTEEYFMFGLIAGVLLLFEVLLKNTIFRNIP